MDSHNVQRYVTLDRKVQNEGDIGVRVPTYRVAFGTLMPKKTECKNGVVPVAVSSSHTAFGCNRMEPVFIILGQSSATVACLALQQDIAVKDLDYSQFRRRLVEDGQVLNHPSTSGKPLPMGGASRRNQVQAGIRRRAVPREPASSGESCRIPPTPVDIISCVERPGAATTCCTATGCGHELPHPSGRAAKRLPGWVPEWATAEQVT